MVDARVLQEAADHRAHADVLRQPGDARAQAADAAHDQVDLHARLAGPVQRPHDLLFGERIKLGDDARRLAGQGLFGFEIDPLHQARMQGERRVLQLLQARRLAHAGELLKDLVHVLAQAFFRRHQAVIGVNLGGFGVVVAGAHMGIALDAFAVAAHHQQHLGVGFVAHHPVHHHGAGLLQAARALDVGLLVEAGAQLHHRGDFLAVTGGGLQVVQNLRVGAGAIERLLDRQHLGVAGRFGEQIDHR